MKMRKHCFIMTVLLVLLISCSSTTAIKPTAEDKGTVFIDTTIVVKAENENKVANDISKLNNVARKDITAKKDRDDLVDIKKKLYQIDNELSSLIENSIIGSLTEILTDNGYTVIDTDNARYTLTVDLQAVHSRNENVTIDYVLVIDLFDSLNVPKDFNPDAQLTKFDGKLNPVAHIDTKDHWIPVTWGMNGRIIDSTEMIVVDEMLKKISTELNSSFMISLF